VYERVMLTPVAGFGVCRDCFNLTRGFERCYACVTAARSLDAIVPISYSVAREPLNAALAGYKRLDGPRASRLAVDLAIILGRFLGRHEPCVARAAGVAGFDIVTTVPSSDLRRDGRHPLRWIVGELVGATRERHERLLCRSTKTCNHRTFDRGRYEPVRALSGERVLLVDDTWTTGANAESAAAALRDGGASTVATVVIGRHLNRYWHENDVRLRKLSRPFDWSYCVICRAAADEARPACEHGAA
jgi:predicted amidophosphoribosyltransferase